MTSGDERAFQVERGPHGRGSCLVDVVSPGVALVIAPPGVPLAPPERVVDLLEWRAARFVDGRIVDAPHVISEAEVYAFAPNQQAWIAETIEREREQAQAGEIVLAPAQELLDCAQAKAPVQAYASAPALAGVGRGSGLPVAPRSRRHEPPPPPPSPLEFTESASQFAAFVGRCQAEAPVRRLERQANRTRAASDFADVCQALRKLERSVGPRPLREAMLALLYARARSHSWRYTRWLVRRPVPDTLRGQLELELDRARSVSELQDAVSALGVDHDELVEALARVLYARSLSRRWRYLAPVRRFLAWARLRAARDVLRESLRPFILQRAPRRLVRTAACRTGVNPRAPMFAIGVRPQAQAHELRTGVLVAGIALGLAMIALGLVLLDA
jgi:hypothetical protein